jgi:hypothetical protein
MKINILNLGIKEKYEIAHRPLRETTPCFPHNRFLCHITHMDNRPKNNLMYAHKQLISMRGLALVIIVRQRTSTPKIPETLILQLLDCFCLPVVLILALLLLKTRWKKCRHSGLGGRGGGLHDFFKLSHPHVLKLRFS